MNISQYLPVEKEDHTIDTANTIWIVSGAKGVQEGEACAAFTCRDKALQFANDYEGKAVMGVELDQWKTIIESGYKMWEGVVKISTGEVNVWQERYFFHAPELDDPMDAYVDVQEKYDRICFYCWARDEAEAIRRADDIKERFIGGQGKND